MARPIRQIAHDIVKAWGPSKINFAAKPYLVAMQDLDDINGRYFEDGARSVVLYFLSNANAFRGDTAKALKAELRAML